MTINPVTLLHCVLRYLSLISIGILKKIQSSQIYGLYSCVLFGESWCYNLNQDLHCLVITLSHHCPSSISVKPHIPYPEFCDIGNTSLFQSTSQHSLVLCPLILSHFA